MSARGKQYVVKDTEHGDVYVREGEHSLTMTNAKPSTEGHWVSKGNSYVWELYKKPHTCIPDIQTNTCTICAEDYYDFEPDEGEGL